MLFPSDITIITIAGGIVLAVIFYITAGIIRKNWAPSVDILLSMVANAMTLTTIGCFMLNIVSSAVRKAPMLNDTSEVAKLKLATAAHPIGISGNEAVVFFVFLYAGGMIMAAVWRGMMALPSKQQDKAG